MWVGGSQNGLRKKKHNLVGLSSLLLIADILDLDDGDHAHVVGLSSRNRSQQPDDAKVTRIIDADSETRKGLCEGIWDNMRDVSTSFDANRMANRVRHADRRITAFNALWHIRSIPLD